MTLKELKVTSIETTLYKQQLLSNHLGLLMILLLSGFPCGEFLTISGCVMYLYRFL